MLKTFVTPEWLSVGMENATSSERIFMKFDISGFFENLYFEPLMTTEFNKNFLGQTAGSRCENLHRSRD